MLRLRRAQMDGMSAAVRRAFERRMAGKLMESFPAECASMDSAALASVIREGIDRAAQHRIDRESDVALYLHLVIALGPAFDSELGWAKDILRDPELPEGARRMQRLYREAVARTSPPGDGEHGR